MIKKKGFPKLSAWMYAGVRVGGHRSIPVPFRWGYGWKYRWKLGWPSGRSYSPLTDEEQAAVDRELEGVDLDDMLLELLSDD